MSIASRKFLIGLLLLLGAGAGIGWIYGHTNWGLLAAALLALILMCCNFLGDALRDFFDARKAP